MEEGVGMVKANNWTHGSQCWPNVGTHRCRRGSW